MLIFVTVGLLDKLYQVSSSMAMKELELQALLRVFASRDVNRFSFDVSELEKVHTFCLFYLFLFY